jgi:hypothetical protein
MMDNSSAKQNSRPHERLLLHQNESCVILECVAKESSLMLSNPVGGAKMVPGLVIDRIKGNPATSRITLLTLRHYSLLIIPLLPSLLF